MQLIYEIKKLGCSVVYASFSKVWFSILLPLTSQIIIVTDKITPEEGRTYFNFLKSTLQKQRPLFRWIGLRASEYWSVLLFKDPFNFIAVPLSENSVSK